MSADAVLAGLILAAWIWVVGSALAPGWSGAERIAAGVMAVSALGWFAMAMGAGILLTAPAFHLSPLESRASHGDMIWHLGWVDQLRAGATAPGGFYAGEPNGYPWLYHAIVGWIAAALPGTVTDSVEMVQALGIATAGVGVWLLARATGAQRSASTWAVGVFLTAGAFGWLPDLRADFAFRMPALELG